MPEVAYVLKGFPRLSELFIASEIHRLERVGVPLRIYVIKPPDEDVCHPLVDRIRAPRSHLPPTTSLSGTTLRVWLHDNLPAFRPALVRVARRRPLGLARALDANARKVGNANLYSSQPSCLYMLIWPYSCALPYPACAFTPICHGR